MEPTIEYLNIVIFFIVYKPYSIKTPTSATFDCHTVHPTVAKGYEGALITQNCQYCTSNNVMVNVKSIALWYKALRIPYRECKGSHNPNNVSLEAFNAGIGVEDDVEDVDGN